jgi:hypothetical protein
VPLGVLALVLAVALPELPLRTWGRDTASPAQAEGGGEASAAAERAPA